MIIESAPVSTAGSDFALLSRRVRAAGLFAAPPGYYLKRFALVGGAYAAGLVGFWFLGDSWWQLFVAAFFALLFGQIALLSHDLAHRQVFRTRRPTEIVGRLVGNFGVGMSYGWWMDKHTRHHANPNHDELDPDVDPDVLVFSDGQARASRGIVRRIGRWQAFLFYPLLLLEGLNLHYSAFRAVAKPGLRARWLELGLLVAHTALYLSALFLVLDVPKAVLFIVVHQGLWGLYMGSIFAPGHKGMPMADEGWDYLRKQVLTTRNVRGGMFVDVAMGGLNYQIEHHLFPCLPSPRLREVQPIVQEYCAELGLPYYETSLAGSWAEVLRHLHIVGAPLREA